MNFLKEFVVETENLIKEKMTYIRFTLIVLLFLLSSLFQLIPIHLFKLDVNNLTDLEEILLTLFSNSLFLLIAIFLYFPKLKKDFINLKDMSKNKLLVILDNCFRYWLIGLIIMLCSNFIINKLGINSSNNDLQIRAMLNSYPFLASISIIFISPLIEEIVFRVAFHDIIKNKWLFVVISGIVFGSLHVIFSLKTPYELLYLIPYCSLGIAFGLIYQKSDNVYISYLIHLLHNSLVAIITFLLAGVIIW